MFAANADSICRRGLGGLLGYLLRFINIDFPIPCKGPPPYFGKFQLKGPGRLEESIRYIYNFFSKRKAETILF